MEKNYIAMEKIYAEKIKQLYNQINEKDEQFKKLKVKVIEVKSIAETQSQKAN